MNMITRDDLDYKIMQWTLEMYNESFTSRKAVNNSILGVANLLKNFYVPFLKQQIATELDKECYKSCKSRVYMVLDDNT